MEQALMEIDRAAEQVLLDEDTDDRIRELRLQALWRVRPIVDAYYRKIRNNSLIMAICNKKIAFIFEARTKNEIDLILSPPKLHYNYEKVLPSNRFNIPEEELLLWSMATAIAPLNDEGYKRFKKVFLEVFPGYEYVFDLNAH